MLDPCSNDQSEMEAVRKQSDILTSDRPTVGSCSAVWTGTPLQRMRDAQVTTVCTGEACVM